MPFKSEKQRRYLWANEPEIARDWADTYGSRIKKDDGGISQLVKSGPGRPGYNGQGDYTPDRSKGSSRGGHDKTAAAGKSYQAATSSGGGGADKWQQQALQQHKQEQQAKGEGAKQQKYEAAAKQYKEKKTFKDKFKQTGSNYRKKELRKLFDHIYGGRKMQFPSMSALTRKADWGDEEYLEFANMSPMEFQARLGTDFSMKDIDKMREIGQALGQDTLSQTGKFKGDNKFAFEDFYPNVNQQSAGGGGGDGQRGGYMGYPSYEAWKAAQGSQGTGATVAAPISAFQQSLAGGPTSSFDYYVGKDPSAKNLAWGKQMGVDPRTMGLTSFAANGGRIPAAFGGIMDSSTGRRAYGFGSIFKKIGRAAKKVLKSPIGKAALIGGAGWMLGGGGNPFTAAGRGGFSMDALRNRFGIKQLLTKDGAGAAFDPWKVGIAGLSALPFFMGGEEEDEGSKFDYEGAKNKYRDEMMRIKAGAMAGTLDPNQFNYLGVKDGGRIGLYAGGQSTPSDYTMEDAMMTTTQDKLGGITDVMKQADLNRQGSVGQFYAAHGGEADDNAWLEARVQELQDEGLDFNAAMAQAMRELSSGKAQGGRIGYAGGARTKTLEELLEEIKLKESRALPSPEKHAEYKRLPPWLKNYELPSNRAQGGRIGYAGGSGRPPVTMGQAPQMPAQPPQAPQRPNPMPAPQPNRMGGMPGGMNPMMGRPMMRGNPMMGGRRMAQEGGLMDLGGMEKDYRQEGGFVPLGGEEKADDVPARLSKNEFVFTADAVRGAGDGDIDKGAEIMENIMKNLEQGGQISEETQGLSGAQEMFGVSERLSEVV